MSKMIKMIMVMMMMIPAASRDFSSLFSSFSIRSLSAASKCDIADAVSVVDNRSYGDRRELERLSFFGEGSKVEPLIVDGAIDEAAAALDRIFRLGADNKPLVAVGATLRADE